MTQYCLMVGARRFELPTPCAQGRCATRLRYAPLMNQVILHRRGLKSRFCPKINDGWQALRQLPYCLTPVAHCCFGFSVDLTKGFAEGRIEKQRIVAKALLSFGTKS